MSYPPASRRALDDKPAKPSFWSKYGLAIPALVCGVAPWVAFVIPVLMWRRATVVLGHTPVYMVDDPKLICGDDTGYQLFYNLLDISLLLSVFFPVLLLVNLLSRKRMHGLLAVAIGVVYILGVMVIFQWLGDTDNKISMWFQD